MIILQEAWPIICFSFLGISGIVGLLALDPYSETWMLGLAYFMLYSAAILTLWSMFVYLKAAWNVILERQQAQDRSNLGQ